MTRGRAMWILFGALVVLLVPLAGLDDRMWDEGGPGLASLSFAWTEEEAGEILAEWGDEGRDAARQSLWLDFPFLVLYAAFGALAVRAVRDAAARRGWERLARA
ncbi:MAG: hypothetical protein M3340_04375, partial [Actinomycetota bacterium]|nr:hypothetical protein [Actinomycetota bacterium]